MFKQTTPTIPQKFSISAPSEVPGRCPVYLPQFEFRKFEILTMSGKNCQKYRHSKRETRYDRTAAIEIDFRKIFFARYAAIASWWGEGAQKAQNFALVSKFRDWNPKKWAKFSKKARLIFGIRNLRVVNSAILSQHRPKRELLNKIDTTLVLRTYSRETKNPREKIASKSTLPKIVKNFKENGRGRFWNFFFLPNTNGKKTRVKFAKFWFSTSVNSLSETAKILLCVTNERESLGELSRLRSRRSRGAGVISAHDRGA